jgi:hypothetical protein
MDDPLRYGPHDLRHRLTRVCGRSVTVQVQTALSWTETDLSRFLLTKPIRGDAGLSCFSSSCARHRTAANGTQKLTT